MLGNCTKPVGIGVTYINTWEGVGVVVQYQHVLRLNNSRNGQDVLIREGRDGVYKPVWDAGRKEPLGGMDSMNKAANDIGHFLCGGDATLHAGFIDLYVVHQSPEFHPLALNLSTLKQNLSLRHSNGSQATQSAAQGYRKQAYYRMAIAGFDFFLIFIHSLLQPFTALFHQS
jgi:hypothetical protein